MPSMVIGARAAHRFLANRSFYSLVFASLLSLSLAAARAVLTHSYSLNFLVWNLFLAWLPYLGSLWADLIARRYPGRWRLLVLPGALWLLFLPNAPYILTDLMHLKAVPQHTLWYDTGMIAMFAWTGCLLAVVSLHIMQRIVERYLGRLGSWLFVLATLGLTGLGVYIGRFLRWNSWDMLLSPRSVLFDVLQRAAHMQALAVSLLFAAFLLACYLGFAPAYQPAERERRNTPS